MAQNVTMRTTYHSSASGENTAVRHVASDILYLYPEKAALWTLMNTLGGMKETIDATKHEWLEKDTRLRWTTVGATTATASTTTIAMTDGTAFVAGMLVTVPTSTGTGAETMRVTSVSGNNVTFSRGFAGTTPGTMSPGAAVRIIGSSHEEGGAASDPTSTNATTLSTYMQIFKDAIEISNTAKVVKIYGTNNRFKQDEIEAMIAHKEGMNAYMYFGPGSTESLTGGPNGRPIRTTQSLVSRISTNSFNLSSGTLTFRNFLDWSSSVFEYGRSKERFLISSPILHKAVTEWGFNRLQVSGTEKVLGLHVRKITTPFGTFKLINDYQLKDGVSGGYGWGGNGFIIDPDNIKLLVLKGRDTHFARDAKKDGGDRQYDEIRTECAFMISREETHGRIYGMTDYQA